MVKFKVFSIFLILGLMLLGCTKGNIKKNGCKSDPLWFNNDTGNFTYPNVFTPNGDGKNDLFQALFGGTYESYHIEIKNGTKTIFEANEPYTDWDGTYKGKDVKEGIYDYTLTAVIGGQSLNFDRSVTVLRDLSKQRISTCDNCVPIWPEKNICN